MLDFTNKTVIVTGSGNGLGRAIAILFAKQGANVVINSLRESTGQETLDQIHGLGRDCIYLQGDVSNPITSKSIVEQTINHFGRIDVLVNNAGVVLCGRLDETSEEDFDRTMAVNVKSSFLMSKYTIPYMIKYGGGVIVNISSCIALKAQSRRAIYAATKGALLSMSKSMALDYIADNIRVNCICPGPTYTEKMEERFLFEGGGDRKKGVEYYKNMTPLRRLGKVSEIASAVLFSASEDAAFMDGTAIIIDGGVCM